MTASRLTAARTLLLAGLTAFILSCDLPDKGTLRGDLTQVAAFNCPSALVAARKSAEPAPLLVLLETNPWEMVIGSDTPAFALYENGQVIYRTGSGYKSIKLDPNEQSRFLDSLQLDGLSRLTGGYRASQATDQPQTYLLVYAGREPAFISVYGSLDVKSVRAQLPPEIATLRNKLRAFEDDRASKWLPDHVEVMIWPYEYAPEPSIVWPERWPGLNAPTTRERGEGSFSIFVPSAEFEQLRAFLASQRPKGAVEIGGKKWAASFRLPFPHERLWMAPPRC